MYNSVLCGLGFGYSYSYSCCSELFGKITNNFWSLRMSIFSKGLAHSSHCCSDIPHHRHLYLSASHFQTLQILFISHETTFVIRVTQHGPNEARNKANDTFFHEIEPERN